MGISAKKISFSPAEFKVNTFKILLDIDENIKMSIYIHTRVRCRCNFQIIIKKRVLFFY